MSIETFKKLPGVLSFQRGLIVTDALFFNRDGAPTPNPVEVIRHGIRGTQNINKDTIKDVNNIQITDTAKTSPDADGLMVRFSVRFLPLRSTLFACAGKDIQPVRQAIDRFFDRAEHGSGLIEVGNRYARNLLNGRWLWRNRSLAQHLTIRVWEEDALLAEVDAFSLSTRHFDAFTPAETAIGNRIAASLRGEARVNLKIEAEIAFGFKGAVEVFPSQNYIEGKPTGFARPLYKVGHAEPIGDKTALRVMGQAALRDQKVSNAIRTIDTWYPTFASVGQPLPVEPQGASLDAQAFFRREKGADGQKVSAFDLVRRINLVDPDSDDGKFLIASFLRGGVFSESEKADKASKEAQAEVNDEA
jgi:CRISPR-associated protein Csy3